MVILGGRNLDFSGNIEDFKLNIDFIQNGESEMNQNLMKTQNDLNEINREDGQANKTINFCQKYEFIANIYGNEDFQIFPLLKITLRKKSFFGDDERFLLFNLSDFLTFNNDNKKKLYRIIFETNLDERKIDQEQYILKEFEENFNIMNERLDESEEIVLKDIFNDYETPEGNEEISPDDKIMGIYAEKNENLEKKFENIDEEAEFNDKSAKQLEILTKYKNMEISSTFQICCLNKDKVVEMEIRKKLRLKLKKQLKYLKSNDVFYFFYFRGMTCSQRKK